MSTRGADDVDMGDEVTQRGVSDAESIEGDEVREPRRRNSPSDPTSRDIEDHVLRGIELFFFCNMTQRIEHFSQINYSKYCLILFG